MKDWFEWNNTRSTAYGIHITEQPAIIRAPERVTFTNVPGRSGSLTTLEADDVYDDFILPVEYTVSETRKTYSVDFISGRALREMEPAANMYAKIVAFSNAAVKGEAVPEDASFTIPSAMDVMIHWFCLLFGNQFTPDDVLDGYSVDRLMHDIALALMAVQTQTTEIPYEGSEGGAVDRNDEHSGLTLPEFIYSTYNSLFEGGWWMSEIDPMDMLGFLKLRAWNAQREKAKKHPAERSSTRCGAA